MSTIHQPMGQSNLMVNLRALAGHMTGVQRYVQELDRRFDATVGRIAPARPLHGWRGHLWEQAMLPAKCGERLLFSPGNSGPLACRRQVVTIHDASTFDCADAFQGAFGRWYRWMLPRLARRVAGVITVSQFSRERLVAQIGANPDHVAVIYNGVTPPPRTQSPDAIDRCLARWQLPARFLLFVGSHDPRKNLARLIEGFLAAELKDVELVIAGGVNERLFAQSNTSAPLPGVRVLGRVAEDELEALYARAEGFVFPSLYEGFGLPPLEAMARGCPVICSSASCLPEVCGPSFEKGGACLYFEPREPAEITAALRRFTELSEDDRQRMAEAGRRHVAQFSWERCARETAAFLHDCATRCDKERSTGPARPTPPERMLAIAHPENS
jgi:glycosyltransferase involved in cell wall biosynthesis